MSLVGAEHRRTDTDGEESQVIGTAACIVSLVRERVLIIEDRPSMYETLAKLLDNVGGIERRWAPHHTLLSAKTEMSARRRALALLAGVELVLLDAFDQDSAQDDPTASKLQSLDILDLLGAVPDAQRPRVVAYSTSMSRPELHIVMWCSPIVAACYRAVDLTEHLVPVLHDRYEGALGEPTPDDWRTVHDQLRPGADLAALHQLMASNPKTWRLVWDVDAPFDQAAQKWIRRNVLPSITDVEGPSYRMAIDVTRRVAGLAPAS